MKILVLTVTEVGDKYSYLQCMQMFGKAHCPCLHISLQRVINVPAMRIMGLLVGLSFSDTHFSVMCPMVCYHILSASHMMDSAPPSKHQWKMGKHTYILPKLAQLLCSNFWSNDCALQCRRPVDGLKLKLGGKQVNVLCHIIYTQKLVTHWLVFFDKIKPLNQILTHIFSNIICLSNLGWP